MVPPPRLASEVYHATPTRFPSPIPHLWLYSKFWIETIFLDYWRQLSLALSLQLYVFRAFAHPGREACRLRTTTFRIMDSTSIYASELTHEERFAPERALATLIPLTRGELK